MLLAESICLQQFYMTYIPKLLAEQMQSIYGVLPQSCKMALKTSPVDNDSDSQSFQPQHHQIKKLGLKINKRKISSGAWTSLQNFTYLKFMKNNLQDFQSEKARRKSKVFFRLSKILLKRRTPDQCRSHHQKLQLKHKDSLQDIMNEVQRKIQDSINQDYLNISQSEQKHGVQKMGKAQREVVDERKYVCIVEKGWFNIKTLGSSLRISIDSNSLQQW